MPARNPANSDGYVLVIGAAGVDVKGRPEVAFQAGVITDGQIYFGYGGVARNIAENLARLEVPTILLTAIGDDPNGQSLIERCEAAGINTAYVQRMAGERTGSYLKLFHSQNDPDFGIIDYRVINQITPEFLRHHRSLFETAALVVIDTNLSSESLAVVFALADECQVAVCADPTSPLLAGKLCDYLSRLYMVAPNSAETAALCGITTPAYSADSGIRAARALVALGVEIAIVTLAEQGLAYADSAGGGHIPAIRTHVVDPTGAGDALTAGVIFGLLNGVPLDEAMRLGVSAATLTLRSRESVVPTLSQELLYDELVI